MPLQLGPVPNFNVNIPSMTQEAMQGQQLRALMSENALRQALAPGQIQQQQQQLQATTLENQQRQMQLQSQKALFAALSDPNFLDQYTNTAASDKTGLGFDPNAALRGLAQRGVDPQSAMAFVGSMIDRSQKVAEVFKTQGQAAEAWASVGSKTYDKLASRLASIGDMSVDKAGAALTALKQDLQRNPGAYQGISQDDRQHLLGADLEHLAAVEHVLGLDGRIIDFHKSQLGEQEQQQKIINPKTGLSPDVAQQAQKDIAVAQATQPLKIQTAMAEAKAKQLLEGMTHPGYAFNPATGQTQLTDQTAYLQSGGRLQGFRPITEKDVRDDTMLTNRLGDVHQKLAEYEQALRKPITSTEKSDIAGLLGEGTKGAAGAKIGFLGAGAVIPMDRLNAFMDSASLGELSPNARDQLIAYRNMREALVGYKTVLSGSARGSDKTMELLEQMIPSPAVTDRDFSQRSLNSFRGNLNVVGQGLPTLPGIKSPTDWENQYRQQRFSRQQAPSKLMQQMGLIGSPRP